MGTGADTYTTSGAEDEVTFALGGPEGEPSRTLSQGDAVGRYLVVEEAGSGGVGVVVRAYDPKLRREVALKLLRARASGSDASEGNALLLREAQAMARLSHPNVLPVYDADATDHGVFIAMEYVEGDTLRSWIASRAHPWPEVLDVMLPAAEGLAAAHRAGIVHRDFKPSNVLIGGDGRVRVMDFGIAHWAGDERGGDRDGVTGDPLVTEAGLDGAIVGTPAYMAPEQHDDPAADARCDQYAFCLTLAEALGGARPFAGTARDDLAAAKRARGWTFPVGAPVPTWLRRIVERGLEPDPDRRWPSMEALVEAVRGAIRRRRRGRTVAAVSLVAVVAGGVSYAALRGQVPASCAADDELEAIWGPERHREVEASLQASGLPIADATWSRVEVALDAYAAAWIAARQDACEATRVRGTQSEELLDRRVACLDQRRRALGAAVDVLAAADRDVALRAVDAASSLPALDPCAESDYLLAGVAPPEDPEVAAQVERTRDEIIRAEALERAGRVADARPIATAALERARALGYKPLLAEALTLRAGIEGAESEQMESLLQEAYFVALAAGDTERAFRVANSLVYAVGYVSGRIDEGLAWGRHAQALAESLPDVLTISIYNNLGAIEARRGDAAAALVHFERSLDDRIQADGPRSLAVAQALANVGGVLMMLDRHAEGETRLRESLEIFEEVLGPDHPNLARVLNNLGIAALDRGDLAQAATYLRRAIRLEEGVYGPMHPGLGAAYDNLGNVLEQMGEHGEALKTHDRALQVRRAALREDHPDLAISLSARGTVLIALERFSEARASFEEALALLDEHDNLREYHQVRFQLGSLMYEHPAQADDVTRGAELVRASYAAASATENLSSLAETIRAWNETRDEDVLGSAGP